MSHSRKMRARSAFVRPVRHWVGIGLTSAFAGLARYVPPPPHPPRPTIETRAEDGEQAQEEEDD